MRVRGPADRLLPPTHTQSCRPIATSSSSRRPAGRRLLADSYESVRQCDWAGGSSCTLGSEYTARTLASAGSDPVAQFVRRSLECAAVTRAAACNGNEACAWDASFPEGQQGCFLSEAAQLSMQQLCVQPRYERPLATLQACVAQRRSCQCADAASCAAATAAGACQPLLGCWLAGLQAQPYDLVALTEVQLLRVAPLLATLTPNATAAGLTIGGGRRRLLQPAMLNAPVFDDSTATKKKKAAAATTAASPAAVKAAAVAEAAGQNKPILSDSAALSGGGGGKPGGMGTLESAAVFSAGVIQAGIIQPETTVATLAAAAAAAASSGAAADGEGLGMTYAPPSFWKCLADAAVAADRTKNWAGIDYNSKKLSLDTWLNVIRKLVGLLCLGVGLMSRGGGRRGWRLQLWLGCVVCQRPITTSHTPPPPSQTRTRAVPARLGRQDPGLLQAPGRRQQAGRRRRRARQPDAGVLRIRHRLPHPRLFGDV
jgi:hypothetical protein